MTSKMPIADEMEEYARTDDYHVPRRLLTQGAAEIRRLEAALKDIALSGRTKTGMRELAREVVFPQFDPD